MKDLALFQDFSKAVSQVAQEYRRVEVKCLAEAKGMQTIKIDIAIREDESWDTLWIRA